MLGGFLLFKVTLIGRGHFSFFLFKKIFILQLRVDIQYYFLLVAGVQHNGYGEIPLS